MDNSTKFCKTDKRGFKIFLPLMYTLIHGHTWYGKYGFRPYDPAKIISSKKMLNEYSKNKDIVRKTKVKNTNLIKYICEIYEQKISDNGEMKKFKRLCKDNLGDMTIQEFFGDFLKEFDKKCAIFNKIYLDFAKDIGIKNYYGSSFYLKL